MTSTRYLLIGSGLAAGEAAKRIREHDPQGSILMVGEEAHVPYDRPPLSKEFLRGQKSRTELYFTQESEWQERHVALALGVSATKLDAARKKATLSNGQTVGFEKALIATGGHPVRLILPGSKLAGIHYLRTLEDAVAIGGEASQGKQAVVIGAGFIGLEVAASLTQLGVQVTVVEAKPHIWSLFADEALTTFVQDYCTAKGVIFHTGETVTEFRGKGRVSTVVTKSGRSLPCDFVCVGAGIVPNVKLAQQAGLEVDNGIVVNEYLQTSHPEIYAAGDVANFQDPLFGKRRRVEHWGHAEYSGQMAGDNLTGNRTKYDLLTYVWSDIFDLHLEFAGDETEHDQVLLRGKPADKKFLVLYLKEKVLRAYFAVNAGSKEFPALQRLIRQKTNLTGKTGQLKDPSVPIKSLA
ncbi:MAG: NAD(P)/FAD-dependent oxidoreductase [Nitrospirales bacterium]